MKKFILKTLSICLVFSFLLSTVSVAATSKGKQLTSVEEESLRLPNNQTKSTSVPPPLTRGQALAVSILSISNDGGGVIGVVATTACHINVEWGMITIYLDRWNEANRDWEFQEEYEYEFLPENQEDGTLHAMTACFDITNQPSGYYYRLRGSHEIEYKNDDGRIEWEGHSTKTNGVMITSTP